MATKTITPCSTKRNPRQKKIDIHTYKTTRSREPQPQPHPPITAASLKKLTPKQQRAAHYNQGYYDAINNQPRNPYVESFYYSLGYDEGLPKRLVPTFISTPNGLLVEKCTLERAAYLLAMHRGARGVSRRYG